MRQRASRGVVAWTGDEVREPHMGWIGGPGPLLQFSNRETAVVVGEGEANRVVFGKRRLDDDFPAPRTAASAAGHLGQQLKRPFAGAKVGEVQANVGIDDAHERDAREVEAFGDHLRAE